MTIIQASHVVILYQGCYSYLAVYFYVDSIYVYMNKLKSGAVVPVSMLNLGW